MITRTSILYNKNALAIIEIAKVLLCTEEGSKIPTVSEFHEITGLARGTIQNSIKSLCKENIIEIEPHGHLGTFLKSKNVKALLSLVNIDYICGVMPLPYSKRLEGLATGLVRASENKYEVNTYLSFMRGAKQRISMLKSGIYDYVILSKYAAELYTDKYEEIVIVKSFGKNSYLSNHVMIFADENATEVKDGMKIGVDIQSVDQEELTKEVCKGKRVKYEQVDYSNIVGLLKSREIDAALWNKDIFLDSAIDLNYVDIAADGSEDTEAVLVTLRDNEVKSMLIKEIIDVDLVLDIQKQVMDKKIIPNY